MTGRSCLLAKSLNERKKTMMNKLFKRAVPPALCALALTTAASAAGTGFTDVPEDAWYASAAVYCRDNGIMSGTSATEFSPGRPMTRAMLAAVLYRMSGSPAAEGESPFSDVKTGDWCGPAVVWASGKGYMGGYGDGRVGPNAPVTREQLAAVLWCYSGSPDAFASDFADEAAIASYAGKAVDWTRSAGVMNGLSDGRFAPKNQTTRAQLAVVLRNYISPSLLTEVSAMDVMCQPCGAAAMPDGSLLVTDTYNRVV